MAAADSPQLFPVPVSSLASPSSQQRGAIEEYVTKFLHDCDAHTSGHERAQQRARRLARVLQPGSPPLSDEATGLLQEIAAVAEVAVECHLRLLQRTSPPSALEGTNSDGVGPMWNGPIGQAESA